MARGKSPHAGSSDLVALGRALQELRKRRGLRQVAVGFDAGRGRSYVSAVEMGYKNPTFVTLIGIVRTLGVPLAELVEVYQRHLDEIDPQAGADVPACPTPEALDYMRQLSARALADHRTRAARTGGRMKSWT